MKVLDSMGVPPDPDPVNRLKRMTSAYTALVFQIKRITKQLKCLKRLAKLGREI
jgi:hypothetical protein